MKANEIREILKSIGYKEELKYNNDGFESYLYSMKYGDELIMLDVWTVEGKEHAEVGIVTDYVSLHVDAKNIMYLFDMTGVVPNFD